MIREVYIKVYMKGVIMLNISKMSNESIIYFYAVDGNTPVGCSEVTISDGGTVGYYNRLFVQPNYRKQGIGRKLWDMTQKELDTRGIDLIIDINPYGDMTYEQLLHFYASDQTRETESGWYRVAKVE